MNIDLQVKALKLLAKNNLQEVRPSFQEKQRDPQSVKLENDVNRLMNQKLIEQNKTPEPVQPASGVKHVGPEEALKELAALMKSTDNKP